MDRVRRLRDQGSQRGQAIVLVAVALVVLMGCAALTIDVGYAWYAKRELQATADAAALAGAQELPSAANAVSRANQYIALNPINGVSSLTKTITTSCNASVPGCNPVNAVKVEMKGKTKMNFAGLFGMSTANVGARATACQPCDMNPLDIMIVFDRTGSMNEGGTPNKITNARNGVKTFLQFLDPTKIYVGLTVLPPSTTIANRCAAAASDGSTYDSTSAKWTVVPLSNDYKAFGGGLNTNSDLVKTLNCQLPQGTTHYAVALTKAKEALTAQGRANVQDVIIFLTDGAANTGPHYYGTNDPQRTRPCWSGTQAAAPLKATTWIYSIGYALGSDICAKDRATNTPESPAMTPAQALVQIASNAGNYYNKPDTGQLNTIFTAIAADISTGKSKLID
jgi:Flp pilus assembly protein TadG